MNLTSIKLTASLEDAKGRRFHVGDHVSWNSEAGRVSGTIVHVHNSDFKVKGKGSKEYTHHASHDKPQYEIRSSKTKHVAYHLGSALTLLNSSNESHSKSHSNYRTVEYKGHKVKVLKDGVKVRYPHRSIHGYGTVEGVHKMGLTPKDIELTIRVHGRHTSASGKKEKAEVYHYQDILTVIDHFPAMKKDPDAK